jgi:hypothetical protein
MTGVGAQRTGKIRTARPTAEHVTSDAKDVAGRLKLPVTSALKIQRSITPADASARNPGQVLAALSTSASARRTARYAKVRMPPIVCDV